jgi:hypothetical protein
MILPSIHHIAWKSYDDATNTVTCTRCRRRLDCKGWAAPCSGEERDHPEGQDDRFDLTHDS